MWNVSNACLFKFFRQDESSACAHKLKPRPERSMHIVQAITQIDCLIRTNTDAAKPGNGWLKDARIRFMKIRILMSLNIVDILLNPHMGEIDLDTGTTGGSNDRYS